MEEQHGQTELTERERKLERLDEIEDRGRVEGDMTGAGRTEVRGGERTQEDEMKKRRMTSQRCTTV